MFVLNLILHQHISTDAVGMVSTRTFIWSRLKENKTINLKSNAQHIRSWSCERISHFHTHIQTRLLQGNWCAYSRSGSKGSERVARKSFSRSLWSRTELRPYAISCMMYTLGANCYYDVRMIIKFIVVMNERAEPPCERHARARCTALVLGRRRRGPEFCRIIYNVFGVRHEQRDTDE